MRLICGKWSNLRNLYQSEIGHAISDVSDVRSHIGYLRHVISPKHEKLQSHTSDLGNTETIDNTNLETRPQTPDQKTLNVTLDMYSGPIWKCSRSCNEPQPFRFDRNTAKYSDIG